MNELERRTLLGAAGIGAIAALAKAGPLNPPAGAVASTGRTLDEIYDKIATPPAPGSPGSPGVLPDGRILIPGGASPFSINQPGSYVLAGGLSSSGGAAIVINAPYVTLDLNGQLVSSNAPAITVTNAHGGAVHIRNGRVSGTKAIEITAAGCVVEDVVVFGGQDYGLYAVAPYTAVRRCTVLGLGFSGSGGATGIYLQGDMNSVHDCTIQGTIPHNDPQGLNTYGIRTVGNGSSIARNRVCTLPAVVGTGVRMDGTGVYRDNSVQGYSVPYGIFGGAMNGGGNVTAL